MVWTPQSEEGMGDILWVDESEWCWSLFLLLYIKRGNKRLYWRTHHLKVPIFFLTQEGYNTTTNVLKIIKIIFPLKNHATTM